MKDTIGTMEKKITKTMRDVLIERICQSLGLRSDLFFVSADFGAPALDKLRKDYKNNFVSVGIAEQNLVSVAAGLGFEGFQVYAYAIAPFLSMRAYEQIKINLSLHASCKKFNVNLVGVGAGLSYDISGASHHCLEDISIINVLPNMTIFSPSDWVLVDKYYDVSLKESGPKYLRFDGKPLPAIYDSINDLDIKKGFHELSAGKDVCLVSTGYMTQVAKELVEEFNKQNNDKLGLLDVFILKPLSEEIINYLKKYKKIITLEEGFINKAGLDTIIRSLLNKNKLNIDFSSIGFNDIYVFEKGNRNTLHKKYGLDKESIMVKIKGGKK